MDKPENPVKPALTSWQKYRQGKQQLNTFLDKSLAAAFKEVAKRNGRSVHAQTVFLIQRCVELNDAKAKK